MPFFGLIKKPKMPKPLPPPPPPDPIRAKTGTTRPIRGAKQEAPMADELSDSGRRYVPATALKDTTTPLRPKGVARNKRGKKSPKGQEAAGLLNRLY